MKHALEDVGIVEAETMLDGDDLIDLGRMSKETRGDGWLRTEGIDCEPGRRLCP